LMLVLYFEKRVGLMRVWWKYAISRFWRLGVLIALGTKS
jgi:hypothetical protein